MDYEITTLPRVVLKSGTAILRPDPDLVYVDENYPAERVMTDFEKVMPITVEPDVNIDFAVKKMKANGVRLLFVTDIEDNISGVITSYDLNGEKPIKYSEETGIGHNDIQVSMMMIPLEEFPAVDYDYVQQSLVRHVIATIQNLDKPHVLVMEVDRKNDKKIIRGIFSSTQISKLLGKGVYSPLHAATSLADMTQELTH